MARYISAELCHLIRKQAYTAGALNKIRRSILQLDRQLLELRDKEEDIADRLAKLNVKLSRYSSIDPARIRPIAANPHTSSLPRGIFTKELVRYMREMKRPVSTYELECHLFSVFGFAPETAKERERLHRKVRKCLRVISAKGAIKRLHNPKSGDGTTMGIWLWTSL
jgi:hypothetical protein